jgi:hypothetical protein
MDGFGEMSGAHCWRLLNRCLMFEPCIVSRRRFRDYRGNGGGRQSGRFGGRIGWMDFGDEEQGGYCGRLFDGFLTSLASTVSWCGFEDLRLKLLVFLLLARRFWTFAVVSEGKLTWASNARVA